MANWRAREGDLALFDIILLRAWHRQNENTRTIMRAVSRLLRATGLSMSTSSQGPPILSTMTDFSSTYDAIQDIIGTDAGNRGMKSLIVPGDLRVAAETLGSLESPSVVVILSGFPCCVNESPPTETDGPPGTFAIARAVAALAHKAIVVTDSCNEAVFAAALKDLALPADCAGSVSLEVYPSTFAEEDEKRFGQLADSCELLIACERAGPGKDGKCYTMREIDMNERGLIAPLHRLVKESNSPFIAIGDGGNELGMGKVIDNIINNPKISNGDKIGCVVAADHLIAASVSNWGGYALAAAATLAYIKKQGCESDAAKWIERCVPSVQDEVALLDRCVAVGCRDGVSGKVEATVDGMPLETSMQCLRDIRQAALTATK
jgi:hypothetical protein